MVRLLLTGSAGQVGTALAARAPAARMEVYAPPEHALDITDPGAVSRALAACRPDVVVNAAAYTAVDRAEAEPERAFAINRDGPALLAEACRCAGVPLVHYSTDYVFDGRRSAAYREQDAANPLGVYGRSKWEGEQGVREIWERHVILRLSWIFSPGGQNFVRTILRLCREREELRVVADQRGCPTAASDVADATLTIAQALARGGAIEGTYHFCGTPATSWYEFAQAIVDEARRLTAVCVRRVLPIATRDYPTPAERPMNSVLDCSALREALDIHPKSWHVALPHAVAGLLALDGGVEARPFAAREVRRSDSSAL